MFVGVFRFLFPRQFADDDVGRVPFKDIFGTVGPKSLCVKWMIQ